MQKTTVNPNPEQEMTVNPFAQEQAAEIQPQENAQTYPAFVEEYPDVRPEDIPQQVWEWAQQEGSLVSAYRKWEIAELRDELAALEMNQKNRRAAVGPAQSDGEPLLN